MIPIFAAVVAEQAPAPPPPAAAVEGLEITAGPPIRGDMKTGVLAYPPTFFTSVRPGTAMDMIRWLPGFAFEDTRDVRGLGGAIGNVLIDGQPPTSKTDTLQSVLARIPASQVDRVDLIVGGAPGIDMRGRQVIANVILKKSERPRGNVSVIAYTQDGRFEPQVSVIASLNRDGVLTEGAFEYSRHISSAFGAGQGTWVRRDGAGGVLLTADTETVQRYPFVKLAGSREAPFAGGKLKFNLLAQSNQSPFHEVDTLTSETATYDFRQNDKYLQGELGARYQRDLAPRLALELQALQRLTHHREDSAGNRPPDPATFREETDTGETVLRGTLRFKRDETLTLESSAEMAVNNLDTLSVRGANGAPLTPVLGGDIQIRENRGEVGETLTWKPNGRYSLIAALRVETSRLNSSGDVNQSRSLTYFKPRLSLAIAPDKDTQIRLRVEREVQQINFLNFVALTQYNNGAVRLGNPNLRPQDMRTTEAVLERRFWNGGVALLTLVSYSVHDVQALAPLVVGGEVAEVLDNVGFGRQTDLTLNLTAPLKNLGLNGAMFKTVITRDWAHYKTDPVTGRRRVVGRSDWIANTTFSHDLPRWKLTWGSTFFYYGGHPELSAVQYRCLRPDTPRQRVRRAAGGGYDHLAS